MVSNPLTPTFASAARDEIDVRRVTSIDLTFAPTPRRPDIAHHAAIEHHWRAASANNPSYFNGTILIGVNPHHTGDGFSAICQPMQFKDFLYWRHVGRPDWGFVDLFGSAVLRANDGAILLGLAASTTMNAGSAYFIGGFLDPRDCATDGRVDIAASIARELNEETGLSTQGVDATLRSAPGAWITTDGRMISIATVYHSALSAEQLRDAMISFSRASDDQEIAEVLVVTGGDDVSDPRILPFTRALCDRLLSQL
jgi:ADP-ribose pyrophosphatase YjhB (NUDIX family)